MLLAEPEQVKGMDFERVYLLGLSRGALRWGAERSDWIPDDLLEGERPPAADVPDALRARRAYLAISRARGSVVLSRSEEIRGAATSPSPVYEAVAEAVGGEEEFHEEELFGPAEGLHATYRMLRDEVLEASWRAGAALSEMRLDTAEDVNRAVARYFELLKLAALIQRPGTESERDSIAALNELLGRIATPEQLAELNRSALDEYVLDEGRDRTRRSEELASRAEPGLEAFLPKRAGGLALSASDVDLYRTCPLKYKFARVFAIPQEPTINQRFGILIHNVLERYHSDEIRGAEGGGTEDGVNRLLELFEAGWRRTGFGFTDDEMQYRDRAVAALARYYERHSAGASRPVWLERRFSFKIGETTIGGRVDRVDRHPDGSYELIDYKTGPPKKAADLADDLQIALYRVAAREAWDIEAADGAYWYVLDDEKVPAGGEADAMERVERTVAEVATGITGQDFEPRPDFNVCSWCDYRLICPAARREVTPRDAPASSSAHSACAVLPLGRGVRRLAGVSVVLLAQEPLELLRDGVAARDVLLREAGDLVLLLLEPLDHLLDLRVRGDGLGDLLLEGGGCLLELGGLDGDPDHALEAAQQRQAGLRVRDGGGVVGDGGPEARGAHAALPADRVEDPEDARSAPRRRRPRSRAGRSSRRRSRGR